MAAPTTTPTNGAGTITTTGEDSGLLIAVNPKVSRPRVILGVSGSNFTSVVLAVRGRLRGLTNFYPVAGVRRADAAPVAASDAISLANSTTAAYEFDATGCDAFEVYAVSGTLTAALSVEARVEPADANAAPLVVANSSTAQTITSTSASAFAVGRQGATNPVLQVDANTASVATGVKVTGAAAAGGVAIAAISSGTNEGLTIDAKGSGSVTINGTATGDIILGGSSTKMKMPGGSNTVEGYIWYDYSAHALKYRDNSGTKTVTAA